MFAKSASSQEKLKELIKKKEVELNKVVSSLKTLLNLQEKIIKGATGFESLYLVLDSHFPKLILKGIDLKRIGVNKIKEDISSDSVLLKRRLKVAVKFYSESVRYLKHKVLELKML